MSTGVRILQLLALLQTHRYWSGAELAERLEVSERTVRRDVDRLRDLGYPVQADRGVGGGYQLRAGTALPPLVLDDDEAVAMAVCLATAAGGSVAGIAESSVRTLSKLVQILPAHLRRRVDALQEVAVPAFLGGPMVDAEALAVLALACRDTEQLRFHYTRRDGHHADRRVEPHRLVSLGRRWYLVCWDVDRADWRSFRVDRLTSPAPTGTRFRSRTIPGGDAVAFVRSSIAAMPAQYEVEVAVQAPTARVEEVVGQWGTVTADGREGWSRLHMGVDSLEWPTMVLSALAAPFEVLGPDELTHHLRETGRRFTEATAGGAQPGTRLRM